MLFPLVGSASIGWRQALVFAALIAATDPVAVVSLFRELGVDRRLQVLVEGESLLNDGTAVVIFTLAVAIATGGANEVPSPLSLVGQFALMVGGGVAVGLLVALGVTAIMRRLDDPATEITLTMLAAYGSFALAESLGVSGVIATVSAGMLCGSYAQKMAMSQTTREAVAGFWSYASFLLNSVVFLLLGLRVHLRALAHEWLAILLAYLAVTIGRAIMIYGVSGLLRLTRERLEDSWPRILVLGGLRGALSMVLALSLPRDFPARDQIVTITFGVVIVSILLQGSATALTVARMTRTLSAAAALSPAISTADTSGDVHRRDGESRLPDARTHLRVVVRVVARVVFVRFVARVTMSFPFSIMPAALPSACSFCP